MNYEIQKIDINNYNLFDDMIFWREHGFERETSDVSVPSRVKQELENLNLYVYAAMAEGRFVGWISLIYLPKVGKWKNGGHIYVDELWVQPSFRRQGIAKALMNKAEELKEKLNAIGIRLYVNVNNPNAEKLYLSCGYKEYGQAIFMEK